MLSQGFVVGKYNSSTYFHKARSIKVMVHGDDFVSSGSRSSLKWFRGQLEKRFEVKTKVIGTGEGEVPEARVLSRIIRVSEQGWEHEGDQRHAELIVKALSLENAKSVSTPSEDQKIEREETDLEDLDSLRASEYRQLAARANFMTLDRADTQYAVKEICRGMTRPTVGHGGD